MPSTVLAGLVGNGIHKDLFMGTNLRKVPDLTRRDWWFRTEFAVPPRAPGSVYRLRFLGISYRARIWLNGRLLDKNAVGSLVAHDYDVTDRIAPGRTNGLALLVTPPAHDCADLSFCTVDWNPEAPDMNAGLWGKVILDTTGSVSLRDPYVRTVLPLPNINTADLTVHVDVMNSSRGTVTTTLMGSITKPGFPELTLSREVTLAAGDHREVTFGPVRVIRPELWWPYQFGRPELYRLTVTSKIAGLTSDTKTIDFGIRQFTSHRASVGGASYVRFEVNGRPFLLRGGGYVWDLLQRWDTKTNTAHVQYVKDMGLNTIRLEGTLGNAELYRLADQAGIMIMAGFVCCSAWERDEGWSEEQRRVAYASLDTQMRHLRHHASAFLWTYGSDRPPSRPHLAVYRRIAASLHWQNPTLDGVATWAEPGAGMKMDGPYVWVPPVLWWTGDAAGGASGTTAEEGTQAPPPLESLRRFLSPRELWPIGEAWRYHSGKPGSAFDHVEQFTRALDKRYGTATDSADYARKAELQNYETARAFFEAWSAHQHTRTFGAIFWMLNNAWPSVHWNLYDYYLKPGGGYFGTKKATEPVHISYDYATRDVHVVNSTLSPRMGLTANAAIFAVPDLTPKYKTSVSVTSPANQSLRVGRLPHITGISATYLIRLTLKDARGTMVSDNLYWYSTHPDKLSSKSSVSGTEVNRYATFLGLDELRDNTLLHATASRHVTGSRETVSITVTNADPTRLAFFVRPEITVDSDGNEVTPVHYSDNYISLWPGESRTIIATYDTADRKGKEPHLRIRGYNVPTRSAPIS